MALEYFQSMPWCNELLTKPRTVIFTPACRAEIPNDFTDGVLGGALTHPDAIPHMLGFFQSTDSNSNNQPGKLWPTTPTSPTAVASVTLLCDLRHRASGVRGIAHGGLLTLLIDEAMGHFVVVNHHAPDFMASMSAGLGRTDLRPEQIRMYTAGMERVRYVRPVGVPGVVAVTVRRLRVEGRKLFLGVEGCDAKGEVAARAEGVWVAMLGVGVKL